MPVGPPPAHPLHHRPPPPVYAFNAARCGALPSHAAPCGHTLLTFSPLAFPLAADLPPGPLRDLLHAAQVSTSLPDSLLASALPTVCGWLASFPRQRGDPSF